MTASGRCHSGDWLSHNKTTNRGDIMRKSLLSLIAILLSSSVVGQVTEPEATVVSMDSIEPFIFSDITIRALVASTVRVMRLEMNEGIKSPLHNHPDEEVFLLLEGQVRAIGGDDTFTMSPGDLFVVPPYVPHQLEALVDSVLIEVGGPGPLLGTLRAPAE